ncbi:MAG TPA: rRNA maturation RNase YbeY [Bacilli bacterium]
MSLQLMVNNELPDFAIPAEWMAMLHKLLGTAGKKEGIAEGEVALTFVDDAKIRALNKEYRGLDKATDVLSFPMLESKEEEPEIFYDAKEADTLPELLGDIVISVPRAQAQSEEYGHSLEREIGFLFVHGFLHLLGYDHQDEASEKAMFTLQEEILREAGVAR